MKLLPILAALLVIVPVASRAEFRAGAAEVILTPPPGVNMAGYYNYRACEGVLDDIHAHALVLDDGVTRAALVTLDLIGSPRELENLRLPKCNGSRRRRDFPLAGKRFAPCPRGWAAAKLAAESV